MSQKLALFLCASGLFIWFLASCTSGPEEKRAIVTVASINDNAPYFSDVLAQGDSVYDKNMNPVTRDDYVEEDHVAVSFNNKPYSSIVTTGPGQPLGEYLVTRYEIRWERTDGGTEVPDTYIGATSIMCPSGEITTGSVVLVPFYEKNKPFLQQLNYLGPLAGNEILCIAHFTFWGHEVGTDRETSFSADLSVNFADKIVKTRPEQ